MRDVGPNLEFGDRCTYPFLNFQSTDTIFMFENNSTYLWPNRSRTIDI